MPSKRGVIVLVVAIALVVGAALWFSSRATSTFHYKPDEASARRHTHEACAALDDFVALVNDNGSAREATALLKRFEAEAQAAYDNDVRWTRLLSSAKALRAGFRVDDANTTRIGYDVAREECRRV
jgi:hypothetical protein